VPRPTRPRTVAIALAELVRSSWGRLTYVRSVSAVLAVIGKRDGAVQTF